MKEISSEKVIQILNDNIENADITWENIEEDLTSLGMDSLGFVKIIVFLEEEFECEIPDTKLLISEMNTAQKIIDVLKILYESTHVYEQ